MPRKTTFIGSWLSDASYSPWLAKGKLESTAKCKWCFKEFDISNMGEPALKSHMKSKKHIAKSPLTTGALKSFLSTTKGNTESNSQASTSMSAEEQTTTNMSTEKQTSTSVSTEKQTSMPTSSQASIDGMVARENVIRAEIRWALKTVEYHFSMRSCDGISGLFQVMFPDSEIAKKFQLSRTKCGYVINHGLAPHFKSVLIEDIQKSPFYTTLFDESLNKKLQRGQMDVLI